MIVCRSYLKTTSPEVMLQTRKLYLHLMPFTHSASEWINRIKKGRRRWWLKTGAFAFPFTFTFPLYGFRYFRLVLTEIISGRCSDEGRKRQIRCKGMEITDSVNVKSSWIITTSRKIFEIAWIQPRFVFRCLSPKQDKSRNVIFLINGTDISNYIILLKLLTISAAYCASLGAELFLNY